MSADRFDDIDRLRLDPGHRAECRAAPITPQRPTHGRVQGEFLKGPVPLSWLTAAANLPGKAALAVGLAVWFEAGRRRSTTVKLTTAILARFGITDRKSKYRGLAALEAERLIGVIRTPRQNPVVTILDNTSPSATGAYHHHEKESVQ